MFNIHNNLSFVTDKIIHPGVIRTGCLLSSKGQSGSTNDFDLQCYPPLLPPPPFHAPLPTFFATIIATGQKSEPYLYHYHSSSLTALSSSWLKPVLGTPGTMQKYTLDGTPVQYKAACTHTFTHSFTPRDNLAESIHPLACF